MICAAARASCNRADGSRAAVSGEAGAVAANRNADQLVRNNAAGWRDCEYISEMLALQQSEVQMSASAVLAVSVGQQPCSCRCLGCSQHSYSQTKQQSSDHFLLTAAMGTQLLCSLIKCHKLAVAAVAAGGVHYALASKLSP